jgi:hypothetical protein
MKKTILLCLICLPGSALLHAQNVGIKTTAPQSALDINGDITLRKGTLTLPAGGSNNVDISTSKYSVYDFAGGALTGGAQLYGFTGGTDGRIVTIFNNSTTAAIQIMNESHPGSASSLAANRIVTGSGNTAVIYQNGSATLRYDALKQRWTITSSNYTDGLSAAPATSTGWKLDGNAGTNSTNFIGTTDAQPLRFAVKSGSAGIIDSALFNLALGLRALRTNTSGNNNTASGHSALRFNTTGHFNTANGSSALYTNTDGYYNTASGFQTLYNNQTGIGNSAFGALAGLDLPFNVNNVSCFGLNAGATSTTTNQINIGNYSVSWIGGNVNWGIYSDGRIKNKVQENVPGLSFIKQLRPVTYNLDIVKQNEIANPIDELRLKKDTLYARLQHRLNRNQPEYPEEFEIEKITQTGFIAQEVEAAAKQTGYDFSGVIAPKNDKGLYSLRYAEFVVPLVKAVQEQQQQLEQLQLLIQQLQIEIAALKNKK